METFINELDLAAVFMVVTGLVTVASGIAALTPNKTDDSFVAKLRNLVNIIAINVGNAKPKDDKNV